MVVLLAMIGAGTVFGQFYSNVEKWSARGEPVGITSDVSMQVYFIEYTGASTRGQPYNLTNASNKGRNYTHISNAMRTTGKYDLTVGDYLTTSPGVRILLTSDTVSGQTRMIRLDEDSHLHVLSKTGGTLTVMLEKGTWWWGYDVQASKMIDYSANCIDAAKVNNWVTSVRNSDSRFKNDNAALVVEITKRKSVKQSFVSGASAFIPDGFSIPSSWALKLVQWTNEAEMAYAIGRAWGHSASSLSGESFKRDLIFIHAGEKTIKDAINNDLGSNLKITPAQKTALLNAAGSYRIKSVNISREAMDTLIGAVFARLYKGPSGLAAVGSLAKTAVSFVPYAQVVAGVTLDAVDAGLFGKSAGLYYKK